MLLSKLHITVSYFGFVGFSISTPIGSSSQGFAQNALGISQQQIMSQNPDDLKEFLTPWLFEGLVKDKFPWSPSATSWSEIIAAHQARSKDETAKAEREKLSKAALAALKAISKTPLEDVHAHNLMKYLPPPSSEDYLVQSLGLLILLDQTPRGLKGRDERYVHSYFGVIGEHLSEHLRALPDGERPDNLQRWIDMGYSYTEALRRVVWYIIPFIHSENLQNHKFSNDYTEKLRVGLEEYSGLKDPYRERKVEMEDETAFKKVATDGPPKGDDLTVAENLYWFFHLLDVHIPIIRKYGRYPYRNNMDGRLDTEDEKDFMKRTENFGKEGLSKEDEEKIRKDVVDGIWSPLDGAGFEM